MDFIKDYNPTEALARRQKANASRLGQLANVDLGI